MMLIRCSFEVNIGFCWFITFIGLFFICDAAGEMVYMFLYKSVKNVARPEYALEHYPPFPFPYKTSPSLLFNSVLLHR